MASNSGAVQYQKRVSVIVLAAGLSTRMGKANKLLLEVDGQPLIRRTLKTLLRHDFTELVVVLGHQADQVIDVLNGLAVNTIYNPDYQEGQMTSVHAGMRALSVATDGVMIFLSDLALIDQQDLHALRTGFDHCVTGVLVPTYNDKRGNPIILDFAQRQGIVAGDKNLGCKRLISKHPELVTPLAMQSDHVVMDMDTPQAYDEIVSRLNELAEAGRAMATPTTETA